MVKNFLLSLLVTISYAANASQAPLVFAASSLVLPLNEIAKEYKAQYNQDIKISYAASSSLARQLSQGAPADIYISANQRWMDAVKAQKLIKKTSPWLGNRLVLVSAKEKNAHFDIKAVANWLKTERIALANPTHVPLGIYSQEALESIGIWQRLKKNLVFTQNARATLALIERQELDFGIIYYSDFKASHSKLWYEFSAQNHSPILYPKALLKSASKEAAGFYQYLETEQAERILLKYGFTLVK